MDLKTLPEPENRTELESSSGARTNVESSSGAKTKVLRIRKVDSSEASLRPETPDLAA